MKLRMGDYMTWIGNGNLHSELGMGTSTGVLVLFVVYELLAGVVNGMLSCLPFTVVQL